MSAEPQAAVPELDSGLGALLRRRLEAIRAGDVGSLPVIIGLVLITAFFYSKNDRFVSPENFNNIIPQMAGVTTIAMGVVFVLLIGEIDLSIGYVSGVAGVIVAELQVPDGSWQTTGIVAIVVAVFLCSLIGAFHASFIAVIGVPSFVVTLAGLLAWQGVVQKSIGSTGVIVVEDNTINNVANYFLPHTWGYVVAGVGSALYAVATLTGVAGRRRHGIRSDNLVWTIAKVVVFVAVALFVVHYSNKEAARGIPFAGLLVLVLLVFWTFVAKRTTFGRHVYAVGGNAEAARRAGIDVRRIRIQVFMISSAMAGIGGVIYASRLNSVDLNAGGGTLLLDAIAAAVIGGTSLFGGRGEVKSALLGALIIATIGNGIDLVGYSSATKFIVTGVILLAAVTLDTISRRRLVAAGR